MARVEAVTDRAPDDDTLFHDIAQIAARGEVSADTIKPETRLFSDLGLDGDDAGAVIGAFVDRFNPDMTDFHWLRYFGDEGFDPLQPVLAAIVATVSSSFRGKWRAAREAEREITIAHLVRVAREKHWIHPDAAERLPPPSAITLGIGLIAFATVSAFAIAGLVILLTLPSRFPDDALIQGLVVIAFVLFPFFTIHSAWSNIERKLASA
jgi:hypothetical protein